MNSITEKKCGTCKEVKNVSEFYTSGRTEYTGTLAGYQSECKQCHNARAAYRPYDAEKYRNLNLKKNHNITLDDFNAMFAAQDGKCSICENPFKDNKGRGVHVDHDHVTGKVRSLLCNNCNILLGHAFDSTNILQKALDYLRNFSCLR